MSRDTAVAGVRAFNRFYTAQIGILNQGYLRSPFSLAEVRVLYEVSHRGTASASGIAKDLGLDPGYLSRILRGFEKRHYITRKRSTEDARQVLLALTSRGRRVFAPLERQSDREIQTLLAGLDAGRRRALTSTMRTIQELLGARPSDSPEYTLRRHRPGDMGWVIHRHGALYAQEYGYDESFEALVAEIAARFIRNLVPSRERCWIAERNGVIVGSVFLVKHSATVAKLRLLLVEPSARGLGIGRRLVDECTRFARRAGYRKITLWTQSELIAARAIYKAAGYRIVRAEPNRSFGKDHVSETWEVDL